MGAGIAATNAGPMAARLRDVRVALDEWIALLVAADRDEPELHARFAAARARLLAGDPVPGGGVDGGHEA
jgi:hypothetical protein